MTPEPEEMMRQVIEASTIDHPSIGTLSLSLEGLVQHGAAALRRALGRVALFQHAEFVSHSGRRLPWKIECDALTAQDWAWAAAIVAGRVSFFDVVGVPRGGAAFAEALMPHARPDGRFFLIVDDVLTTGGSLREQALHRSEVPILGVTLFSRSAPPEPWMKAIFIMDQWDLASIQIPAHHESF